MERGESPGIAAKREVLEETGVSVYPRDRAGYTTNSNDAGTLWIVTLFVICDYASGEAQVREPEKCPEVRWVPLDEMDSLPLFTPLRLWRARQEANLV